MGFLLPHRALHQVPKREMYRFSALTLFEEGGGLIENDNFYMGAKSKWQVDLQDTIDTRYDLYFKSQCLSGNGGSE